MVASFMEKTVSKSYVRLPGSGSDKKAGASFCDLSRGSSLAASISVPQNMGMQNYVNAKMAPTAQNKRPRTENDTIVTHDSTKKPRLDSIVQDAVRTPSEFTFQPVTVTAAPVIVTPQGITTPQGIATPHGIAMPRGIATSQGIATPQGIACNFLPTTNTASIEPIRQPQNPTPVYIIRNAGPDVKKLQEENAQLKSENANLHKQLSLFKQLMRNPQRLQSVVQRLNERQN